MNLNIKKPLAFIDLETTGTNITKDKIVEISILKLIPDNLGGGKEIKTQKINPTIPIPPEASKIHNIYDEDVANMPTFKEYAPELLNFLENCDLAGYNSNKFDIPLLVEEFLRAGFDFDLKKRKLIDVQVIFHTMEKRTLEAAYKFYCNKTLDNAHNAEADIIATYEVLLSQLEKYENLENDIDFLHKFTQRHNNVDIAGRIVYNSKGKEVFNFGKHKGKTVEDVLKTEPSYYNWIMNGDFPLHTKKVLQQIKLRVFNNKN